MVRFGHGDKHLGLKFGLPGLTQQALMTTIELSSTKVIPHVRDLSA
jgi:hypothetical protein